jgi:hypothetical protein
VLYWFQMNEFIVFLSLTQVKNEVCKFCQNAGK